MSHQSISKSISIHFAVSAPKGKQWWEETLTESKKGSGPSFCIKHSYQPAQCCASCLPAIPTSLPPRGSGSLSLWGYVAFMLIFDIFSISTTSKVITVVSLRAGCHLHFVKLLPNREWFAGNVNKRNRSCEREQEKAVRCCGLSQEQMEWKGAEKCCWLVSGSSPAWAQPVGKRISLATLHCWGTSSTFTQVFFCNSMCFNHRIIPSVELKKTLKGHLVQLI